MIEISDFSKLDNNQKGALLNLLSKDMDKNEWPAGVYDDVVLKHTIVKHLSSPKYGLFKNERRCRYEVLDNKEFNYGKFSKVYKSLFTLSIDVEGNLNIKKRKNGTYRLIKQQDYRKKSVYSISEQKETMINEANAMLSTSFFHSKPLVLGQYSSYICMRELPGIDLLTLLNTNNLSIKERYDLTLALLRALKTQIHDKGFVHKDIKYDNILIDTIDNQFVVYILDYGFIKIKNFDDSKIKKGSPIFAPPESYITGIQNTEKSDIYSLGKVLMYLWGDYDSEDRFINGYKEEANNPVFDNLFERMNPKPTHQSEIKNILQQMCHPQMEKRPTIDQLIELFLKLEGKIGPYKESPIATEHKEEIPGYDREEAEALERYFGK